MLVLVEDSALSTHNCVCVCFIYIHYFKSHVGVYHITNETLRGQTVGNRVEAPIVNLEMMIFDSVRVK